MRRFIGIGLALAFIVASTTAIASAQTATPPTAAQKSVAIAIGQLIEDDGERATVDLRGASDGTRVGGTLRFYSADHGYYNGAIRSLSIENGTIKAAGGGGLFKPDGTRVAVKYTATIAPDKRVEIAVTGRNGFAYTLSGRLDPGFVKTN